MIKLLSGDCRDVLATLPAESVQCVVTSPPYYGLRDYGTALWDGGDAGCQHTFARNDTRLMIGSNGTLGKNCTSWTHRDATPPRQCACGAVRVDRQIGLEATPDLYLQTMVGVFREVRRVLRTDGTVWCNLGDSYASAPSGSFDKGGRGSGALEGGGYRSNKARSTIGHGAKPKDLLLMPARLALALQADGWWVRSDIIWHKPNPMPESVTDRPTSAHEHVFLLTKSARYYYDADAVREDRITDSNAGTFRDNCYVNGNIDNNTTGIARCGPRLAAEMSSGRNLRNVWTIPTFPFSAAHFATFPRELAERCIRAGTSERGCCAACGKPWGRITDKAFVPQPDVSLARGMRLETQHDTANQWPGTPRGTTSATSTGWAPGCKCDAATVPCTVLDPFAGAGTTLLVADRLQRDAIGIELSPDYTTMAMERCRADAPLFTAFPPAEPPEDARMADLFAEATE